MFFPWQIVCVRETMCFQIYEQNMIYLFDRVSHFLLLFSVFWEISGENFMWWIKYAFSAVGFEIFWIENYKGKFFWWLFSSNFLVKESSRLFILIKEAISFFLDKGRSRNNTIFASRTTKKCKKFPFPQLKSKLFSQNHFPSQNSFFHHKKTKFPDHYHTSHSIKPLIR